MTTNCTWMTLEQLSEYLQMKPKAVYDLVHKKKIPFTKIVRRLRFNKEEIDRWLQGNSQNSR